MFKKQPYAAKSKAGAFSPRISFVIPVHNQAAIIRRNILSIAKSSVLESEYIIIDDASTDETLDEVLEVIDEIMNFDNVISACVYTFKNSRFETMCDDFGIRKSASPYVIEVQADMEIHDYGFDARLSEAMVTNRFLFALSGRGTQMISPVAKSFRNTLGTDRSYGRTLAVHLKTALKKRISPKKIQKQINVTHLKNDSKRICPDASIFTNLKIAGRIDHLSNYKYSEEEKRTIWVGETIMRGPLIIDRAKYVEVPLSVGKFFQGYDDHDLCLRAFLKMRYRCGFVPVEFSSPLTDGTTRKSRSIKTEFRILHFIIRSILKKKICGDTPLNDNLSVQEMSLCESFTLKF